MIERTRPGFNKVLTGSVILNSARLKVLWTMLGGHGGENIHHSVTIDSWEADSPSEVTEEATGQAKFQRVTISRFDHDGSAVRVVLTPGRTEVMTTTGAHPEMETAARQIVSQVQDWTTKRPLRTACYMLALAIVLMQAYLTYALRPVSLDGVMQITPPTYLAAVGGVAVSLGVLLGTILPRALVWASPAPLQLRYEGVTLSDKIAFVGVFIAALSVGLTFVTAIFLQ